ncbi:MULTISPECIES: four helix bundle protein [Flavobacterium]|uniref:Four helix bundle protein n=1 Tax=Flavobacterium nitrogenifigens TaxID=1617283 RepID=A0A521CEV0_9FLAO|nr:MULTISPECIES: four helix bundle protein [Flavobacterium]KAF2079464.1 four helix bundle protein [Flavobacterium sharifuzzamanii]KAF2327150.1 four helix bundle protein [Flavobacterium nitrogenifigens]SMO57905.1 four helix bundle protein [Flavobacterium nitrogenifigens]
MRFQDLLAYKKSFSLAMKIFNITKQFPKEETYSLTDQIRRSSRSVTVTIAEAYRKRIYPKHFYSKLTDSDGENSETQTWLEFAFACKYISNETYDELLSESIEIGKLLNYMLLNPEKFGVRKE